MVLMNKFIDTLNKGLDIAYKWGVYSRLALSLGVIWLLVNFALQSLYSPPVKVVRHDLLHVVTYNYVDNNGFWHTKCKYFTSYKKHGDYYAITLENGNVLTVHKSNIIKLGN